MYILVYQYIRVGVLNCARTEAMPALAADRADIRVRVERFTGGHRTAQEEIAQVRHRAHLRPPLAQQRLGDLAYCAQRGGHWHGGANVVADARECGSDFTRRGMLLLRSRPVALLDELAQLIQLYCI